MDHVYRVGHQIIVKDTVVDTDQMAQDLWQSLEEKAAVGKQKRLGSLDYEVMMTIKFCINITIDIIITYKGFM